MGWKQPIDTKLVYEKFDKDHLARDLFIHLLLRARGEDMEKPGMYKGKPYKLKRGQVLYGRNSYGELLRASPSGTDKALMRIQDVFSEVTCKRDKNYSIVTLINYDSWVDMSDMQSNKQVTSKKQASDTNKNVKNDKNEKNINTEENFSKEKFEQSSLKEKKEIVPFKNQEVPTKKKKKNTEEEKELNKSVNLILDKFNTNRLNDWLYKNMNQRESAKYLLRRIGLEKLSKSVDIALSLIGTQYAPQITTPEQLKYKFNDLLAYWKKQNANQGLVEI